MNTQIIRPPTYQRPNGKLYLSAQQENIVNVTWTLVELNQIMGGVPPDFKDGIEDIVNHRIKPGMSGFYTVFGQAVFNNIVLNKSYNVAVCKNGVQNVIISNKQSSIVDFLYVPCSDIIFIDEDDYLDLRVKHTAGVDTVDISNGTGTDTRLTVQRVR